MTQREGNIVVEGCTYPAEEIAEALDRVSADRPALVVFANAARFRSASDMACAVREGSKHGVRFARYLDRLCVRLGLTPQELLSRYGGFAEPLLPGPLPLVSMVGRRPPPGVSFHAVRRFRERIAALGTTEIAEALFDVLDRAPKYGTWRVDGRWRDRKFQAIVWDGVVATVYLYEKGKRVPYARPAPGPGSGHTRALGAGDTYAAPDVWDGRGPDILSPDTEQWLLDSSSGLESVPGAGQGSGGGDEGRLSQAAS